MRIYLWVFPNRFNLQLPCLQLFRNSWLFPLQFIDFILELFYFILLGLLESLQFNFVSFVALLQKLRHINPGLNPAFLLTIIYSSDQATWFSFEPKQILISMVVHINIIFGDCVFKGFRNFHLLIILLWKIMIRVSERVQLRPLNPCVII